MSECVRMRQNSTPLLSKHSEQSRGLFPALCATPNPGMGVGGEGWGWGSKWVGGDIQLPTPNTDSQPSTLSPRPHLLREIYTRLADLLYCICAFSPFFLLSFFHLVVFCQLLLFFVLVILFLLFSWFLVFFAHLAALYHSYIFFCSPHPSGLNFGPVSLVLHPLCPTLRSHKRSFRDRLLEIKPASASPVYKNELQGFRFLMQRGIVSIKCRRGQTIEG